MKMVEEFIKIRKDISVEGYFHLSTIFNKSSDYDSLNLRTFINQKKLKYKSFPGL